ncbi:MAG: GNAT family N-acetyltransferase [Deltaproteobacteria bacterium]|nr:MAG: GNAT family N-acetyltransferase [Deltaproteobacteria bacterium]
MTHTRNDFVLRPATREDGPAVMALVSTVLQEYGLKTDPQSTDADLADIEASYLEPGGWFQVVVGPSGDIVGSVGLFLEDSESCELRKMYLLPQARGVGLGRELLDQALEQARQSGFRRVTLETAKVLKEAIAMYERYGFQPYRPEHLSSRCDGAYELWLSS